MKNSGGVRDTWSLQVSPETRLVPVNYGHQRELFQLVNQNRVSLGRWLPWVMHVVSPSDLQKLITYYRQKNQDSGAFTCCVLYQHRIAGILSVNQINPENQSASLGYWLGSEFQRLGLMRLCCENLINFLFETPGLHKITIRCAAGNTASQRIPEFLGFEQEALLRDGEWLNDHYVDLYSYGMLRRNWLLRGMRPEDQLPEDRPTWASSRTISGGDF